MKRSSSGKKRNDVQVKWLMFTAVLWQNREALRFGFNDCEGKGCYYIVSLFNDSNIRPFTFSPEATSALPIHTILEWQAVTCSTHTHTHTHIKTKLPVQIVQHESLHHIKRNHWGYLPDFPGSLGFTLPFLEPVN